MLRPFLEYIGDTFVWIDQPLLWLLRRDSFDLDARIVFVLDGAERDLMSDVELELIGFVEPDSRLITSAAWK